jgi:hypothetical protein
MTSPQFRRFSQFAMDGETFEVKSVDFAKGIYIVENVRNRQQASFTYEYVNDHNAVLI